MLDYNSRITDIRIELLSDFIRLINLYGIDGMIPLQGVATNEDNENYFEEIRIDRGSPNSISGIILKTNEPDGPFEVDITELDTDMLISVYKSIHLFLVMQTHNIDFNGKNVVSYKDIEKEIKRLIAEHGHNGEIEGMVDITDDLNTLNITTLDIFIPDADITEDDIDYEDDEFDVFDGSEFEDVEDDEIDEFGHEVVDEYGDILNVEPMWMKVSLKRYGSRGYMFHYQCEELGLDEYVGMDQYDLFYTMLMYDTVYMGIDAKKRYEEKMLKKAESECKSDVPEKKDEEISTETPQKYPNERVRRPKKDKGDDENDQKGDTEEDDRND